VTALAETLAQTVGVKAACAALNLPRSRVYRARQPSPSKPRLAPARALSAEERAQVRQTLNSERFAECAPRQVYAA
jgi:putative transposase